MRLDRLVIASAILLAGFPASESTAQKSSGIPTGLILSAPRVDSITEPELAAHLQFLASDLMKGRDTASPEIRIAADYLATRLAMFGAEPTGDLNDEGETTYFAKFPLTYVTPSAEETTITFRASNEDSEDQTYLVLEDFQLLPFRLGVGDYTGDLVFGGYGRTGSDGEPNDFEGLDVQDKIIIVVDGDPAEAENEGQESRSRSSTRNLISRQREYHELGAKAVIFIHPFEDDAEEVVPYSETRGMAARVFGRRSLNRGSRSSLVPVLFIEDPIRDAIDEIVGLSDDPTKPRELRGIELTFSYGAEVEEVLDNNVIGLFPGSDDELKDEVVIFSAHYDHIGVRNGEVYNGADDNGSGTSALLEIAEAISLGQRPRRSIAFLWVSGEELGLLGSAWWADHMTLPDNYEIVANINMDMVSRNDPNLISATPSPDHPDYSTLIPAAITAAETEGMTVEFNADQYYARTDSYNFAVKDIPIIFFFAGTHPDYHGEGDEFDKTDTSKATRVARLSYRLGWAVAQADEAPVEIAAPSTVAAEEGE